MYTRVALAERGHEEKGLLDKTKGDDTTEGYGAADKMGANYTGGVSGSPLYGQNADNNYYLKRTDEYKREEIEEERR